MAERDEAEVVELPVGQGPIAPIVTGRWVKARKLIDGVLYQHEMIQCGKRRVRKDGTEWVCRCMQEGGRLHGPYWYAYRTARGRGGKVEAGGRWQRKYIGRELP